jgi:hypothetical protein
MYSLHGDVMAEAGALRCPLVDRNPQRLREAAHTGRETRYSRLSPATGDGVAGGSHRG